MGAVLKGKMLLKKMQCQDYEVELCNTIGKLARSCNSSLKTISTVRINFNNAQKQNFFKQKEIN